MEDQVVVGITVQDVGIGVLGAGFGVQNVGIGVQCTGMEVLSITITLHPILNKINPNPPKVMKVFSAPPICNGRLFRLNS